MSWALEFVEVRSRPHLGDVSFGVPTRTVAAIVADDAALRTAVFRLAVGLDMPDRGAVLVCEQDVSRASARTRGRLTAKVGAVFGGEDFGLFGGLSAFDNVRAAVHATGRAGRRAEKQHAAAALERVGLSGAARARPDELTRAQARRLALARAIATRPQLVLFGAFDSHVDALEAKAIGALLHEERDTRGCAVAMFCGRAVGAALAEQVIDLDGDLDATPGGSSPRAGGTTG